MNTEIKVILLTTVMFLVGMSVGYYIANSKAEYYKGKYKEESGGKGVDN